MFKFIEKWLKVGRYHEGRLSENANCKKCDDVHFHVFRGDVETGKGTLTCQVCGNVQEVTIQHSLKF
jgi:transcription elongation factor Elf1